MKLYVVRHGETIENSNDCLCGRINSSLTEKGLNQAIEVKKMFANKKIDLIVSSPLERCKQTAEIIADNEGKVIESVDFINDNFDVFNEKGESILMEKLNPRELFA